MKHSVYWNSFDKDAAYHRQLAAELKAIRLPPIVQQRATPCYPPVKVSRVGSFAAHSHAENNHHKPQKQCASTHVNTNITFILSASSYCHACKHQHYVYSGCQQLLSRMQTPTLRLFWVPAATVTHVNTNITFILGASSYCHACKHQHYVYSGCQQLLSRMQTPTLRLFWLPAATVTHANTNITFILAASSYCHACKHQHYVYSGCQQLLSRMQTPTLRLFWVPAATVTHVNTNITFILGASSYCHTNPKLVVVK